MQQNNNKEISTVENRQKQIEEMAREALCDIEKSCDSCVYECGCAFLYYAERFFDIGCRKVPKNAVVLTERQYDEYIQHIAYAERNSTYYSAAGINCSAVGFNPFVRGDLQRLRKELNVDKSR